MLIDLKAKIGEIGVLLQEFHQMAVKIAKNPACTQDFTSSSMFRRFTPVFFPAFRPPRCPVWPLVVQN